MDQHPIPQDVTGFQFKLIGAMTVKQFGYVATGAVLAFILYYIPINTPWGILLKVFLIPFLGASGVIIAFVPVDGRPIDVMTTNFVKALFSPNQYIYHRQGRKMSFSTVTVIKQTVAQAATQINTPKTAAKQANEKEEKLRAFLMNSHGRVKNDLDKKEASFLKSFAPPTIAVPNKVPAATTPTPLPTKPAVAQPALVKAPTLPPAPKPLPVAPAPKPVLQATTPVAPAPVTPPQKETPEMLAQKEQVLEQQLAQAKQEEAKPLAQAEHDAAHNKVTTLASQIEDIHAQKQKLEQELASLQTQLTQQKNAPVAALSAASAPTVAKPTAPLQDPHLVKVVSKDPAVKKTDVPRVSDTPNVVVGIVKDPRGNILSNILVEVKDKDGNPVRAFKTNPLGQFASATPLSPGVYTMELEDPKKQHNFDVIQITANNEIMRPIEVISHDAREALRQQLFAS